jgi:hypothetical protein
MMYFSWMLFPFLLMYCVLATLESCIVRTLLSFHFGARVAPLNQSHHEMHPIVVVKILIAFGDRLSYCDNLNFYIIILFYL